MTPLIEQFIISASAVGALTRWDFQKLQRGFAKASKSAFFTNDAMSQTYHKLIGNKTIAQNVKLEKLLMLKSTRSDSGVAVVTVLTKPFPCPGACIYCPSEKNVPKSYLAKEPAVMRAIMCRYHPFRQMETRLRALKATGHITDKISVRIVGGTWSYYPKRYQAWFVKELFRAANKDSLKLKAESGKLKQKQLQNESASHRIVELSVETRQDYININEIKRLRMLGVTKVELGVQSIYDNVLKLNRRGHDNLATIEATKLLKDAGFKVSYQIMVNLYGSDKKRDVKMFEELFGNENYQPDHLKIYPLAVLKNSPLYADFLAGKFKPYDAKELIEILVEVKAKIPAYCRIERVIRDIPTEYIVEGGAKVSNLRQEVQIKLKSEGKSCRCIRCREIKNEFDLKKKYKLYRYDYEASGGHEIFLSIESRDKEQLLSFLRLRIPSLDHKPQFRVLNNAAIIREIHTYGPVVAIGSEIKSNPQHQGFGKKLIAEAEKIAKEEFHSNKIAAISGVGVRPYFKSLEYRLKSTYMVKEL